MAKKLFLFLILATAARPAFPLELSLEENRGESGTVGYVDIDKVFKEYSGTSYAREEFLSEIKKKEGSVNQRKHAIYSVKADIAKLRQERAFALNLPSLMATQESIALAANPPAAQTAAPAAEPAPAEVEISSAAVPAETILSSSEAVSDAVLSTAAVTGTAPVIPARVPAASTTPVSAIPLSSLPGLGIDMPGVAKVPANYFKFSVSTSVPEIDAAISAKEADLKQKEDELKVYQRQMEKELLEYESHKSEILLGRIYMTLKELAIKEEVSVIVDKRHILFGHSAVDLTAKLLDRLEESQ